MNSYPIELLKDAIQGVAYAIAPEKADQLKRIQEKHDFSYEITEEIKFKIRVDLKTATIILPIRALDYLWSCAFSYWIITQEYTASQRSGASHFNPLGNKRLIDANTVLLWTKSNLSNPNYQSWPANLPKPEIHFQENSDIHVANELFLSALGWIVQHEIAHVVLNHPWISSFSIQEEREADRYATDWILGSLESDDPKLKKRGLGIATALLCLESIELDSQRNSLSATHPPAYRRLEHCLSQYKLDQEENIQAFSLVVLQVLYSAVGIATNINGKTFQEILDDFMIDVSRI